MIVYIKAQVPGHLVNTREESNVALNTMESQ